VDRCEAILQSLVSASGSMNVLSKKIPILIFIGADKITFNFGTTVGRG